MRKYLVVDDEVAYFYTNEENPQLVAKWGLGVLDKVEGNVGTKSKDEMVEVSEHMEKLLDEFIGSENDFLPLDGTIKYPLNYDECSPEVKELIDETFHDDAVRKHYNLSEDEEVYS